MTSLFRDLRLHKLVFEDDVLPDGTELGYYARGQVRVEKSQFSLAYVLQTYLFNVVLSCVQKLLDGFKKGAGIHCNCCDTVVRLLFLL